MTHTYAILEVTPAIGRARLVDVLPPCRKPVGTPKRVPMRDLFTRPCAHRWHAPEQYAFVLDHVRPTTFVAYKGALSFFDVPDDVVRRTT